MDQSEFEYTYTLSSRRGQTHHIGVRADPDLFDTESFAAVLFFSLPDGTRVPVARVDNSPHVNEEESEVHVDRFYREAGAEIKDYRSEISGWEDADDYLKANWEDFADHYHQHYGAAVRDDGANA